MEFNSRLDPGPAAATVFTSAFKSTLLSCFTLLKLNEHTKMEYYSRKVSNTIQNRKNYQVHLKGKSDADIDILKIDKSVLSVLV